MRMVTVAGTLDSISIIKRGGHEKRRTRSYANVIRFKTEERFVKGNVRTNSPTWDARVAATGRTLYHEEIPIRRADASKRYCLHFR